MSFRSRSSLLLTLLVSPGLALAQAQAPVVARVAVEPGTTSIWRLADATLLGEVPGSRRIASGVVVRRIPGTPL